MVLLNCFIDTFCVTECAALNTLVYAICPPQPSPCAVVIDEITAFERHQPFICNEVVRHRALPDTGWLRSENMQLRGIRQVPLRQYELARSHLVMVPVSSVSVCIFLVYTYFVHTFSSRTVMLLSTALRQYSRLQM